MIKNILLITCITFFTLGLTAQSISTQVSDSDSFEAGSTLTLNLTYTTDDGTDIIYAALERKKSDGTWDDNNGANDGTIVNANIQPVPATGTGLTATIDLAIPAATVLSANLTNGEYYGLHVEVRDSNWQWQTGSTGAYPKVTIVAAGSLSVSDVNNAPATIYPNPARDVVNILPINGASFNNYKVFDITGKIRLSHTAADIHKVDVSELSRGVYFLQLDNYNAVKFIKK